MLSSVDNILIKHLWECKKYGSKRFINDFHTKIGKEEQWTTFCKDWVQQNALQEVVDSKSSRTDDRTLKQSKN